jgi:hypothetical protein
MAEAVGHQMPLAPLPEEALRLPSTSVGASQRYQQFVKARRSASQVIMEQAEVLEGIMDALSKFELALGVLVPQRVLHGVAEETAGTRNGEGHGSDFTKDQLMPPFD